MAQHGTPKPPSAAYTRAWVKLQPAVVAAGGAGDALTAMRQAAGPKRTWSAHDRLREKAVLHTATLAVESLAQALRAVMPKHWGLDTWGIRLAASGPGITWAQKNGSGQNGLSCALSLPNVAVFAGFLAGVACEGPREARKQRPTWMRFRAVYDTPKPFMVAIHDSDWMRPAPGLCPTDAAARMAACGVDVSSLPGVPASRQPEAGFAAGWGKAVETIGTPVPWTHLRIVWPTLFSNPTSRRLLKTSPRCHEQPLQSLTAMARVPRADERKVRNMDRIALLTPYNAAIAQCQTLLDAIGTPPAGPLDAWKVHAGTYTLVTVRAWSGLSAMLAHALSLLASNASIQGIETWEAWPVNQISSGSFLAL